jgi:hypothetical protein
MPSIRAHISYAGYACSNTCRWAKALLRVPALLIPIAGPNGGRAADAFAPGRFAHPTHSALVGQDVR